MASIEQNSRNKAPRPLKAFGAALLVLSLAACGPAESDSRKDIKSVSSSAKKPGIKSIDIRYKNISVDHVPTAAIVISTPGGKLPVTEFCDELGSRDGTVIVQGKPAGVTTEYGDYNFLPGTDQCLDGGKLTNKALTNDDVVALKRDYLDNEIGSY